MIRRAVLLALVFALALAAPAPAATLNGKYLQLCEGPPVTGAIDPLVSPGGTADHDHAEFGARNFTASSTTASFLNGSTSCVIPGNHAAYWTPPMVKNGVHVYPTSFTTYYGAFGADTSLIAGGKVYPFPQGLRFLVGNSKSITLQSAGIVKWRCDAAGQPTVTAPPASCPAGVGLELFFASPACWDGLNLDSADHRSHMSYVTSANGCPASHPVRLPLLNASFHFPPAAVGGCPDSDHGIGPCGRSAHMDLWEAQDAMQQALLTQCLNDPARSSSSSPLCGLFTYRQQGTVGNPWLVPLMGWTAKLDYIAKADGTAAAAP